jgi:hypothetical protein
MKFVIEQPDGTSVTVTDARVWAAANGVEITGKVTNPRRLPQVKGLPILKGFVGPYWKDGTVLYAPNMMGMKDGKWRKMHRPRSPLMRSPPRFGDRI